MASDIRDKVKFIGVGSKSLESIGELMGSVSDCLHQPILSAFFESNCTKSALKVPQSNYIKIKVSNVNSPAFCQWF
jgi:hypothetical protein